MSKDRRIYVVGGDTGYASWIDHSQIVNNIESSTIVLFTGGSDVGSDLYKKSPHPTTFSSPSRDKYEVEVFKRAREMGKKFIGICRGHQFLTVMAGGILCQHQSHPHLHNVTTNDHRVITVTSTHHQRACIKGIEDKIELLAWAEHLSPYAFGQDNNDLMDEEKEPEIIFFKEFQGLGLQSHPEYCMPPREGWEVEYINYCRGLLSQYLD